MTVLFLLFRWPESLPLAMFPSSWPSRSGRGLPAVVAGVVHCRGSCRMILLLALLDRRQPRCTATAKAIFHPHQLEEARSRMNCSRRQNDRALSSSRFQRGFCSISFRLLQQGVPPLSPLYGGLMLTPTHQQFAVESFSREWGHCPENLPHLFTAFDRTCKHA